MNWLLLPLVVDEDASAAYLMVSSRYLTAQKDYNLLNVYNRRLLASLSKGKGIIARETPR